MHDFRVEFDLDVKVKPDLHSSATAAMQLGGRYTTAGRLSTLKAAASADASRPLCWVTTMAAATCGTGANGCGSGHEAQKVVSSQRRSPLSRTPHSLRQGRQP